MKKIAVLLTCHNRREKTISCLTALYACSLPDDLSFDVYLVDDGSTDGTKEAVEAAFPAVQVIVGSGNLFWAAGSVLAWETAMKSGNTYDFYLLLNDDTLVLAELFEVLKKDLEGERIPELILVGSTMSHDQSYDITYGGKKLIQPGLPHFKWVIPNNIETQDCDLGNANIMLVSQEVVDKIGILTKEYLHGFADYDYTLTAKENNIPVKICSRYLGYCENDHGKKWLSKNESSLKERIAFMYSVKGLSYDNYLKFTKKHYPKYYLEAKIKMWAKTLFPGIYDKFKKEQ